MCKEYHEDGVVRDKERARTYYSSEAYARASKRLKTLEDKWVGQQVKYWGEVYEVRGIVSRGLNLAAKALIAPFEPEDVWGDDERLVSLSTLILIRAK